MIVFINNQEKELSGASSLTGLLNILNFDNTRGLALAVNNQVIPRAEWNSYIVGEKDKVTIIRATQGG